MFYVHISWCRRMAIQAFCLFIRMAKNRMLFIWLTLTWNSKKKKKRREKTELNRLALWNEWNFTFDKNRKQENFHFNIKSLASFLWMKFYGYAFSIRKTSDSDEITFSNLIFHLWSKVFHEDVAVPTFHKVELFQWNAIKNASSFHIVGIEQWFLIRKWKLLSAFVWTLFIHLISSLERRATNATSVELCKSYAMKNGILLSIW